MAITETQRLEMHLALREVLGESVADTMMEHMPPTGWADVARKDDVARVEQRIDRLESRMGWAISAGVAFGLALLAIQVQIMLAVSRL